MDITEKEVLVLKSYLCSSLVEQQVKNPVFLLQWSGHCCGTGSVPGPGTSTCCRRGHTKSFLWHWATSSGMLLASVTPLGCWRASLPGAGGARGGQAVCCFLRDALRLEQGRRTKAITVGWKLGRNGILECREEGILRTKDQESQCCRCVS